MRFWEAGSTYLVENQEIPQGDAEIPSYKEKKKKADRQPTFSLFYIQIGKLNHNIRCILGLRVPIVIIWINPVSSFYTGGSKEKKKWSLISVWYLRFVFLKIHIFRRFTFKNLGQHGRRVKRIQIEIDCHLMPLSSWTSLDCFIWKMGIILLWVSLMTNIMHTLYLTKYPVPGLSDTPSHLGIC